MLTLLSMFLCYDVYNILQKKKFCQLKVECGLYVKCIKLSEGVSVNTEKKVVDGRKTITS